MTVNATLTHLDDQGHAHMVDVGNKADSEREARARAVVCMQPSTLALLLNDQLPKGDVLATARIAGIQAAKRTHELIPLCHPLLLTHVSVQLQALDDQRIEILACCRLRGKTGVEMEALTAATVAALTLYDMCKAVDRGMTITDVQLLEKRGGVRGDYRREGAST